MLSRLGVAIVTKMEKKTQSEIVSDSSQNYRVYSVFYGGHEYGIGFWMARTHLFEKLTQRCRNLIDFGSQVSKFPRILDISRWTSRLPGASSARQFAVLCPPFVPSLFTPRNNAFPPCSKTTLAHHPFPIETLTRPAKMPHSGLTLPEMHLAKQYCSESNVKNNK